MAESRASKVFVWCAFTSMEILSSWSKRAWNIAGPTAGGGYLFFWMVVWTGLLIPSEEFMSERLPPSDLALFRGEQKGAFLFSAILGVGGFGGSQGGRLRFLQAVMTGRIGFTRDEKENPPRA
jgi:hypothetical protein